MKTRTITGLILALVLIPLVMLKNNIIFSLLVLLIGGACSYELSKLHKNNLAFLLTLITVLFGIDYYYFDILSIHPLAVLLFSFVILSGKLVLKNENMSNFTMSILSLLTISFASLGVLNIFSYFDFLMFTIIVVFANDVFAYYAGSLFGKHKLSPEISPKKTIEGAIGGVLVSNILGLLYIHLIGNTNYLTFILIGLVIAVTGIIGDLFVSKIKRDYKIKDFSNILPGHGGVFDRFDAFLFCSIAIYAMFISGIL